MNTVELLQFSLGSALDILKQVVTDLTQEQADWTPPGTANSIGALYWHTISGADEVIYGWILGQAPLHQEAGWQAKVLSASAPADEQDPAAQMRAIRVRLPAMHEYAQAVTKSAQDWLASLTPQDLERQMDTPIGELNLGQMLEVFVVWHINAHCGEISALKGCQGAKGYPF